MTKNKKSSRRKLLADRFQYILFITSLIFFSVCYGVASARFEFFPAPQFTELKNTALGALPQSLFMGWLTKPTAETQQVKQIDPDKMQPGLTKITGFGEDYILEVKIIDKGGNIVNSWEIDWFELWGDAQHIPEEEIPHRKPGTFIHGSMILPNGDLLFNFEYKGLVRLDYCGGVIWKLPRLTHHSIFQDDDGNFWVGGRAQHEKSLPGLASIKPPFSEPIIMKVSGDGEVLLEKSLFDLLIENNQKGHLYLSGLGGVNTTVEGDLLHLNDVEVFSSAMEPGFFKAGDVMVSLRNTNTVMVFDQQNWKLKYRLSDAFISQHDADFIDGNSISVYDNNNINTHHENIYSRIVTKDVVNNKIEIAFQGSEKFPVYSRIMGKHQWLKNGNLLFTESMKGRAIEVSKEGKVVWEYFNIQEPGRKYAIQDAERLPVEFDKKHFEAISTTCNL